VNEHFQIYLNHEPKVSSVDLTPPSNTPVTKPKQCGMLVKRVNCGASRPLETDFTVSQPGVVGNEL